MTSLTEKLGGWTAEDFANISVLLGLDDDSPISEVEEGIKWLYHSRTRQGLKDKLGIAAKKAKIERTSRILEEYETPSWNLLVLEFAKTLKVYNDDYNLEQLEEYLSHAVIIQALNVMSPEDRAKFFNESVNLAEIVDNANIKNPDIQGPQTALALISATHLSGFSVYMASTTALGFASGAVGVTLPFAAYTGMTTTLSVLTGPLGFTAAIMWGAWRFTGPEWKKLAPIILYIISRDARLKISERKN